MEKEIIVKKIDWRATLNKFKVGDTFVFNVTANEMISIRQVASRHKKQSGKIFTTSISDKGILVRREV